MLYLHPCSHCGAPLAYYYGPNESSYWRCQVCTCIYSLANAKGQAEYESISCLAKRGEQ
jgi:hypothetical protein